MLMSLALHIYCTWNTVKSFYSHACLNKLQAIMSILKYSNNKHIRKITILHWRVMFFWAQNWFFLWLPHTLRELLAILDHLEIPYRNDCLIQIWRQQLHNTKIEGLKYDVNAINNLEKISILIFSIFKIKLLWI